MKEKNQVVPHGESVISIPRDRSGRFEPIAVPKHESRGLSIEKLVISLYAKWMSVSDIEAEMREIYEIELSTSAIFVSIRTNAPFTPRVLVVVLRLQIQSNLNYYE